MCQIRTRQHSQTHVVNLVDSLWIEKETKMRKVALGFAKTAKLSDELSLAGSPEVSTSIGLLSFEASLHYTFIDHQRLVAFFLPLFAL
jgi:hypothetical protein